MKRLYTFWKWLLSYRKKEWVLSDYPVQIIKEEKSRPDIPSYRAAILEWLLMGFGETKEEALADLKKNFDQFLINNPQDVTRPGVMKPLDSFFESHEGIDKHFDTARKFTELVLGFEPEAPFFISDQSALSDFNDEKKQPVDYVKRTKEVFDVDISDIEDGNLLSIFERIDEYRSNPNGQSTNPIK